MPAPAVAVLAGLAAQGPVLEFAIGTGRVALPLAAHGLTLAGIELSPDMVARLRAKPGGEESAIPVLVGDMATAVAPGAGSFRRLAGMDLESRWADWQHSPFTAESDAHVSVWRKR